MARARPLAPLPPGLKHLLAGAGLGRGDVGFL